MGRSKKLGEEEKKPEEKIGDAACFGPDSCDTDRLTGRRVGKYRVLPVECGDLLSSK